MNVEFKGGQGDRGGERGREGVGERVEAGVQVRLGEGDGEQLQD